MQPAHTRATRTTPSWRPLRQAGMALVLVGLLTLAQAEGLPAPIESALRTAGLPADTLSLWVAPAEGGPAVLAHHAQPPANPASLMKLVTSAVALARLGPGYRWRTALTVDQPPQQGRLAGNLYVRGGGDPQLTPERLWLLLQGLRSRGIQRIDGDIVLDRSAFALPEVDPGAFDGEPFKPYNVQPDALVISHKAVIVQFRPAPAERIAYVIAEPALQGWAVPTTVPLSAEADCGDWRGRLQADWHDPAGARFFGSLPAICGERSWPVAPPAPALYNARAIAALWAAIGGQLGGTVRDGVQPATALPLFEASSPTLGEVLRDMNKFSNNLLADQLMLTLSLAQQGRGSWEASRALMDETLQAQARCAPGEWSIDRGSGLSRNGRLSARCLGEVLRWAWRSPWMPELVASLPIAGEDTARRAVSASGRAHLKTGSLNGTAGLAGFIDAAGGRRYVFVAILNHNRSTEGPWAQELLNTVLAHTLVRIDATP